MRISITVSIMLSLKSVTFIYRSCFIYTIAISGYSSEWYVERVMLVVFGSGRNKRNELILTLKSPSTSLYCFVLKRS